MGLVERLEIGFAASIKSFWSLSEQHFWENFSVASKYNMVPVQRIRAVYCIFERLGFGARSAHPSRLLHF